MEEKDLKVLFELAYLPFYKQQLEYALKPMLEALGEDAKDIALLQGTKVMVEKLSTEEGMYQVFCDTVVPHVNKLNKTEQKNILGYVKGASVFQKIESAAQADYLSLVVPEEIEPSSLN